MSTAASGLKELHELHLRLHDVQEVLRRGPKQIEARKQFTARKQAELEQLRDELKNLKMATDQKSLQLKSNESKIADLKVKLNSASSNREFDIIKSQIEADSMANSVLEDEILEALDKIDQLATKVRATEAEVETASAEERRVASEVEQARPEREQKAHELRSNLQATERQLPATILESYRRLVQAHGAGALASVENKACTACFAVLSPQSVVDVNTGKIVFCRSCGRMLYRSE